MGQLENLKGKQFGRWTVKNRAPSVGGKTFWFATCACSPSKRNVVRASDLKSGKSSSCGCWTIERTRATNTKHGASKNNQNRTPEYEAWRAMRERCNNPSHKAFTHYGGRGIRVCKRWETFPNFLMDMGPKPSPQHSIERKNNNGPYTPSNCFWATKYEQVRNMRTNVWLEVGGRRGTIADWARWTGLPYMTIYGRKRRGRNDQEAVAVCSL